MPTTQLFDLSGRVALVTGGNGGIGRSIAIGLAEAGAAVAILARNEEKNQRVSGELRALGVRALAVRVDVTERGQLQPALEKVEETLGPVNILVNNAGISAVAGVLDHTLEDWDRVIETNLNACFLLSKLTAKSMAIELAPFNIQVNAIAPGWIETDLTAPLTTAASGSPPALLYQEIIRRTPAGRFGNPDECVGTAVFLASRASDFVTGATICVDGGYSIR